MLKYTHLYNTSDVTKPYNLCCIESDSSNINLYVNDIFKATIAPNKGSKYSFVAYKALDISKENLVQLLAKGTIEADSYSLAERKSIFNDKNYCYIKKLTDVNLNNLGGSMDEPQPIAINTRYLSAWSTNAGTVDGQNDYLKFSPTQTGIHTCNLKTSGYLYLEINIYLINSNNTLSYLGSQAVFSGGTVSKNLTFVAGYNYALVVRHYYSYSSRVDYEASVIQQFNTPTTIPVIDLKAPITKYLIVDNGKLVLSDKAQKFYFNPKYFNLPQLYLKLYGIVPSSIDINYNYSDNQQLSIINTKVITFSANDYLPLDIDISTFVAKLDSSLFKISGNNYYETIDNLISLDDFAKFNDKIKLASGTEKLEFTYSPNTTTLYNEQNIPVTTSARIFHYPVTFYNPNKKVLFSFPLNKGVNSLVISKTIGSITYNKSLQVTRT